jgi:hypothetical protein
MPNLALGLHATNPHVHSKRELAVLLEEPACLRAKKGLVVHVVGNKGILESKCSD